jgi:hypothetical protein
MSHRCALVFVIDIENAVSPLTPEKLPVTPYDSCVALHSIEFFVVVVVVDCECAADAPAAGPIKTATTTRAAR